VNDRFSDQNTDEVDTYDKLVTKLREKYTKKAIDVDDIIDKLERMQPNWLKISVKDYIDNFEDIRKDTKILLRILNDLFTQHLPKKIVDRLQTIIGWRQKSFDEIISLGLEIEYDVRSENRLNRSSRKILMGNCLTRMRDTIFRLNIIVIKQTENENIAVR
jgi:hypothetical protein